MAEYCVKCFSKIFNEKPKKGKYILSKEPDLCEGCGEWKQVVVRFKRPKLYMFCKKIKLLLKNK